MGVARRVVLPFDEVVGLLNMLAPSTGQSYARTRTYTMRRVRLALLHVDDAVELLNMLSLTSG